MSAAYIHTTTEENLAKILDSGKLVAPSKRMNTADSIEMELLPFAGGRFTLPSKTSRLVAKLFNKNPDKIFLTKETYDPRYGNVYIVKQLKSPKPSSRLTLIPQEHVYSKDLSVKSRVSIFIPDEKLEFYKTQYPQYKSRFKSHTQLNYQAPTFKERLFQKTADLSLSELKQTLQTPKVAFG
jgi:hypothetical protein